MADEKSHNDIYQAIGGVIASIDALKSEMHEIRMSQVASEKRWLEELKSMRTDHLMYGRRIAALEKWKTWILGAAMGCVLVIALVAVNAQDFIHKITGK